MSISSGIEQRYARVASEPELHTSYLLYSRNTVPLIMEDEVEEQRHDQGGDYQRRRYTQRYSDQHACLGTTHSALLSNFATTGQHCSDEP